MASKRPFTKRQKLWIQHYLESGNHVEAAKLAGYPEKHAGVHGWKLKHNKRIMMEVQRIGRLGIGLSDITVDALVGELWRTLTEFRGSREAMMAGTLLTKILGADTGDFAQTKKDNTIKLAYSLPGKTAADDAKSQSTGEVIDIEPEKPQNDKKIPNGKIDPELGW